MQAAGEDLPPVLGDLHRHSLVSRCTSGDEPSLEDFYRYAWDVDEYDFWAVTDHAENSTAYQWWSIQKIADLLHVPGRFVPLYGFEWTSAEHGHQNVIYGDVARGAPIFSAFAEGSTTPDGLCAGSPSTPSSRRSRSRTTPVRPWCTTTGTTTTPASSGSSRCSRPAAATTSRQMLLPAVLRRHRDRHVHARRPAPRAPVRADRVVRPRARRQLRRRARPRLSRADVFEALQARRTCAARTRDVFVDPGWAGTSWAATSTWTGPRPLRVHAAGYAELARVDILRDGEVVHTVRGEPDLPPGHRRVDCGWSGARRRRPRAGTAG